MNQVEFLQNLVEKMKEIIPDDEVSLQGELKKFEQDIGYCAPEIIPNMWFKIHHWLQNYVRHTKDIQWSIDLNILWEKSIKEWKLLFEEQN